MFQLVVHTDYRAVYMFIVNADAQFSRWNGDLG